MKIFLLFIFPIFFFSQENWLTNFEEAQKIAQQENKNILINFSGSDWCAPCIRMKQEIFASEDFNTFASKNLVLVKADFPRLKKNQLTKEQILHNEGLAEKYNEKGLFPYTVLVDADGKVLKSWDGYPQSGIEGFIKELE